MNCMDCIAKGERYCKNRATYNVKLIWRGEVLRDDKVYCSYHTHAMIKRFGADSYIIEKLDK